jgi:hypothetical protein
LPAWVWMLPDAALRIFARSIAADRGSEVTASAPRRLRRHPAALWGVGRINPDGSSPAEGTHKPMLTAPSQRVVDRPATWPPDTCSVRHDLWIGVLIRVFKHIPVAKRGWGLCHGICPTRRQKPYQATNPTPIKVVSRAKPFEDRIIEYDLNTHIQRTPQFVVPVRKPFLERASYDVWQAAIFGAHAC